MIPTRNELSQQRRDSKHSTESIRHSKARRPHNVMGPGKSDWASGKQYERVEEQQMQIRSLTPIVPNNLLQS